MAGIGHNDGPPLVQGRAWRSYIWKRAKTEQLPKLGIETVRRHVRRAAQLGLTYPQYLVMLVLWEEDGITISDLGKRLTLDSGTLTPLVKRMEKLKLLGRQRDIEDERRVRVSLTTKGRRLCRRAESVPSAAATATGCSFADLDALTTKVTDLRACIAAQAEN